MQITRITSTQDSHNGDVLLLEGDFALDDTGILHASKASGTYGGTTFVDSIKSTLLAHLKADSHIPRTHEVFGMMVHNEPMTLLRKWSFSVVTLSRFMA